MVSSVHDANSAVLFTSFRYHPLRRDCAFAQFVMLVPLPLFTVTIYSAAFRILAVSDRWQSAKSIRF
jgi:hypothetical protein